MDLYNLNNSQLSSIEEKDFKLEKDIQKLFEENLEEILGIKFVKTEWKIKNKRIDTLAYDEENKTFKIIEYKRQKNSSVIDQGFNYLKLMHDNKADFILTYNETLKKNLHSQDIDWTQARIIFVSTNFTEDQKSASDFKDSFMELYEVRKFDKNIIVIQKIETSSTTKVLGELNIGSTQNSQITKYTKEIKVYTEESHFENKSEEIMELYQIYKNAILNLSNNIDIIPKKMSIGFKKKIWITDITILQKELKIWINLKKGELDDPKKIARDVSNIGHWGLGDYEIKVKDTQNLEYIMSLIKQALK